MPDSLQELIDNGRFATPAFLGLLALLPLLALWIGRRGRRAAVRFPSIGLFGKSTAHVRARAGHLMIIIRLLGLALLAIALARPQFGTGTTSIEASGIDIVLAIDLSESMWAHDFEVDGEPVDRLTVVKQVVEEFIEQRPNDRLGIIAFANEPYLVSPLTLNHAWLQRNLERLEIGLVGNATAIGSAISMGANRLRKLDSKSRIMILLTDGVDNASPITPETAAEAAKAHDIKIYTIGAGKGGIVPMPRQDMRGNILRRPDGTPVLARGRSEVDFEALEKVAEITGGRFYQATDTEGLAAIYDQIDELEKTEIVMNTRVNYEDLYIWPALAGFIVLGLEQLLSRTRYRTLP